MTQNSSQTQKTSKEIWKIKSELNASANIDEVCKVIEYHYGRGDDALYEFCKIVRDKVNNLETVVQLTKDRCEELENGEY